MTDYSPDILNVEFEENMTNISDNYAKNDLQYYNFCTSIDDYGNNIVDASSLDNEKFDNVLKLLNYDDNSIQHAIIIYNLSTQDAKLFNDEHETKLLHQYASENGDNIFVVKRGSPCPEILNKELYAGAIAVVVKHDNNYYTIYQKDKSKNMLTLLGGNVNRSEFTKFKIDKLNMTKQCAIRQVYEETESIESNQNTNLNGLDLSKNNVIPVLKLDLTTKLFKIPGGVKDNFYIFSTMLENDQSNLFLTKLFSEENKDGEHYTMKYDNCNSKTEFIHAVKIESNEQVILADVESFNYNYKKIVFEAKSPHEMFNVYKNKAEFNSELKWQQLGLFVSSIAVAKMNNNLNLDSYLEIDTTQDKQYPNSFKKIQLYKN